MQRADIPLDSQRESFDNLSIVSRQLESACKLVAVDERGAINVTAQLR